MTRYLAVFAAALSIATALGACGGSGSAPASRIVCADVTKSTAGVRASYLPGIEEVAQEAALSHTQFYAASCGSNPTGTVAWPVHKELAPKGEYSGTLADEFASTAVKRIRPRLKRLTATSSARSGTPLGQMLAVAARQCDALGGACSIYLFTDGAWADRLIRVHDGVTGAEQRRYVAAYAPRLAGLAGASVSFVGVGHGTSLGEARLHDAERVATALVEKAGGHVTAWNVRLASGA